MAGAFSPNPGATPPILFPLNSEGNTDQSVLDLWEQHNPINLIRNWKGNPDMAIHTYCGDLDEFKLAKPNKMFSDTLDKYNLPHTYRQDPNGDHINRLFTSLPQGINFLYQVIDTAQIRNYTFAEGITSVNSYSIYPNPANEIFFVSGDNKSIGQISVFNLSGQKVMQINHPIVEKEINIGKLGSGIYLVSLKDVTGKKSVLRLIKNKIETMRKIILSMAALIVGQAFVEAQENMVYQKPSREILELVDYERAPSVMMDELKENLVFTYQNTYKTLDDLNQEELQLGGLRINPVTNISSSVTYINNLKVRKFQDENPVQVKGLPGDLRITHLTWSPDETKMAFTITTANAVQLWVLDIGSATATRVSKKSLNANMGKPFSWYNDNQHLLVRVIPEGRPVLTDFKNSLPVGPIISNSDGVKAPNRTYQDLLKNKTDEDNFETLVTSELYKINLNGDAALFMGKAMYGGENFSPDGNYLLVTTLQKPFSYMVPLNRFPLKSVVYDLSGKEMMVVNEVPLAEVLPKGFMAVRKGKRNMNWRNDQPSALYYAEALDEGNPENKVDFRDAVYQWNAPFTSEPVLLAKTIDRFGGINWGNETTAVLFDDWYDTRNTRTYLFNPSNPDEEPRVISNRNSQDIYSDPGNFEMHNNAFGRDVLLMDNDNLFLIGAGFTKDGQFPFIDQFNLKSLKTNRIYQSAFADKMERILSIKDVKKGEVLVQIQSKSEYPNYYLRNLKKRIGLIPVTQFKNPFESIANVEKSLIKYKRKDGVELSGTLYLPAGYDKVKKEKLPLLIWAYPTEYKDKNSAGQSSSNPNQFTFPYYGSFVYWVTKGYAVLDNAAFPIVGEGETEPNDNFISQLVDNAEAAINAVDSLGYIDRKKVAVGGHSYGAFMTANLLTHSNLFACGIARSGAYNRTLTPFGFQREQRNYWETPEVYNSMSPFMNADKMKTPLLLVHGEADNNPGTFTLQTERYFQALKGLGAPVRMVLLPKESHGYVAKENILHLLWEQDQFFEKFLKK